MSPTVIDSIYSRRLANGTWDFEGFFGIANRAVKKCPYSQIRLSHSL